MNKPIISFAGIILSLLFAFFYVLPLYRESIEHKNDIKSLEETLKVSSEIKTLISETKESLKSIEGEKKASFEVFLPEKIDPVRFANDIQSIGRKNRIVLSGIKVDGGTNDEVKKPDGNANVALGLGKVLSIGEKISQAGGINASAKNVAIPTPSDKKYFTTTASFAFVTTYETFQLFLNDLEKSLELIEIKSLSFSGAAEDVSLKGSKTVPQPVYQFAMSIETYSLK